MLDDGCQGVPHLCGHFDGEVIPRLVLKPLVFEDHRDRFFWAEWVRFQPDFVAGVALFEVVDDDESVHCGPQKRNMPGQNWRLPTTNPEPGTNRLSRRELPDSDRSQWLVATDIVAAPGPAVKDCLTTGGDPLRERGADGGELFGDGGAAVDFVLLRGGDFIFAAAVPTEAEQFSAGFGLRLAFVESEF